MLLYFMFSYPVRVEWWILTLTTRTAAGIAAWRNWSSGSQCLCRDHLW